MVRINRSPTVGKAFQSILPLPIQVAGAPATTDTKFQPGQVWLNTTSGLSYMLTRVVGGAATWNLIGPGASDVDTINSLAPAGGNIIIDGGTNLTDSNAGSTVTLNMDAAITLATSVTSQLYTSAAANLLLTAPANQSIVAKLGDAAGVQTFSVTDASDVAQFTVNSNGALTMGAVTFTGLVTASASMTVSTAGTALNLGSDNSGDAVNLAVGTTARTVGIANSAGAHLVTIGSTTGAASLSLQAGTGNFTLNGNAATTYTIGAATTSGTIAIGGTSQTGLFTLGGSDGIMIMNIANADGAKTINVGAGVDGNTISVGNGINTSAQIVNIANGASAANSTLNVLSGTGTAGAGVLNLANNTRVTTVDIADIAPAAARTVNVCGGDSAQNDTFNLLPDNPSAGTQTVNILSGVPTGGTQVMNLLTQTGQAGTINVATGAAMANAINIGGTGACVIALGNTQTAGSVAIGDAMTGGSITIGGTGLQTGAITIGSGTGAQTVNLATGATGIKTVNLATGLIDNVVTIGSTTGAASLTLQAGTQNITMTGTVNAIDAKFVVPTGIDINLNQSPVMQTNATTGGAATGATGDVNLMALQEGVVMEQFILGAGQTIISPRMTATGLNIALDQVDDEGAEYNFGAARVNSQHAFTIGTSAAFRMDVTITVADVSGCEPLLIGFRRSEANNATMTAYQDYASIGLDTVVAVDDIILSTELNGAGTVNTNTTDAFTDGQSHKLSVLVSAAGVVTYEIDDGAPAVTAAFTFDNADVVCPFIHFLNGADIAGDVELEAIKIGFQ